MTAERLIRAYLEEVACLAAAKQLSAPVITAVAGPGRSCLQERYFSRWCRETLKRSEAAHLRIRAVTTFRYAGP